MIIALILYRIGIKAEIIIQQGRYFTIYSIFLIFTPSKVHFLDIRKKGILILPPINLMTIDKWERVFLKPLLSWQRRKNHIKIYAYWFVKRKNFYKRIIYGIGWIKQIKLNLLEVTKIQQKMSFRKNNYRWFIRRRILKQLKRRLRGHFLKLLFQINSSKKSLSQSFP